MFLRKKNSNKVVLVLLLAICMVVSVLVCTKVTFAAPSTADITIPIADFSKTTKDINLKIGGQYTVQITSTVNSQTTVSAESGDTKIITVDPASQNVKKNNPKTFTLTAKDATETPVKVTFSYGSGTDKKTATINVTVYPRASVKTNPKAISNLKDTGEAKALIEAGTANDGKMQYALGTENTAPTKDWSADIPKKADAGTYYVWYKVVGDNTHSDSTVSEKPITVTIAEGSTVKLTPANTDPTPSATRTVKIGQEVTVRITNTYNGKKTVSANVGGEEPKNVSISPASKEIAKNNGTGDFKVKATEYFSGSKEVTFQYTGNSNTYKAVLNLSLYPRATASKAPTAKSNLTYTSNEIDLINKGETKEGTLFYALGQNDKDIPTEWNEDIPKGKNAGTYYVWYKIVGDDEHSDSEPACISATVAKRNITLTSDSDSKTYDGSALTKKNVTVTGDGFVTGEGIQEYNFTGSRTDVGSSENTFSVKTWKNGTKEGNYNITTNNGTLTVNAKQLTVSDPTVSNKKYDGTKTATVNATAAGVLDKDKAYVTLNATGEFNSKDVGTGKSVAVTYSLTGDKAGNYSLNKTTDNKTANITARAITITSKSDEKDWDGAPLVKEEVDVTGDGFAEGEGATYDFTGSQTDVGSSSNTFTINWNQGTNKDNYTLTKNEGTLKVNALTTLTVCGTSYNATYDGVAHGAAATAKISDVTTSEATISYSTDGGKTWGADYPTVTHVADSVTVKVKAEKEGYVTATDEYELTVTQSSLLTVQAPATVTFGYDKEQHGDEATVQVDGKATSETITISYSTDGKKTWKEDVPQLTNAGSVNVDVKAENDDFVTAETAYTLTVTPAKGLLAVGTTYSAAYDGAAHAGTAKAYLGGDEVSATITYSVDNGESWSDDAPSVTNVEDGKITVLAKAELTNYETATSEAYTLEVLKKAVIITSKSDEKTYDGTALITDTEEIVAEGFVEGEGVTYTSTGTITFVGEEDAEFTYGADGDTKLSNYSITPSYGKLKINKITTPIVITAGSAERKYDGEALTETSFTYTDGVLVEGDTLSADMTDESTITNAGTQANKIDTTSIKVTNGDGDDVTSCYTFAGTMVDGTLKVTKRDVTLTSATDSKTYNGSPLTNNEVSESGDGFVTGEGATYDVTGSQTVAGTSDNTFTYSLTNATNGDNYNIAEPVYGKLTVNPIETVITLTAGSDSRKYDGTPLTSDQFTYTADVLLAGDVLSATTSGTITDAGSAANKIDTYKVMRGDVDVTASYTFAETMVDGTLTISKRDVTLTSATDSKTYDGSPLTNSNVTESGDKFVTGEGATYDVTGSQTFFGYSNNVFTYKLNEGTKLGNYNISTVDGTLTINQITTPITITAASETREYNGTALTNAGFTFTEDILVEGDELKAVMEGSILDKGTTTNTVSSYKVMHGETDVTNCYTFAESESGVLEVTAVSSPITITANSQSRVYDGTALTDSGWTATSGILVSGDELTVNVTGSQTDAGESENQVGTFAVMREGKDITENYSFATSVNGTLKVEKRAITLTSASDAKTYDGEALTAATVTDTLDSDTTGQTKGFVEGEGAVYTVTGTRTDAGSSENTFTYELNGASEDNYTIATVVGTLTVNPKAVTVTPDGKSKIYLDQDPELTVTVDGLIDADKEKTDIISYKLSRRGSEDVGKYDIDVTGNENQGNYKVTYASGKEKFVIEAREFDADTVVSLKGALLRETGKELTQEIGSIEHSIYEEEELVAIIKVGTNDYEIVKGTNVGTKAGNYTMTIKGKNNFKGEVKVEWMILSNDPGKVDPGKGEANIGVKESAGAPKTEINKSEVFAAAATADELKQVINGAKLDVALGVKDASKSVTDEAKKEIEKAAKGKTILAYLDITMEKEFTPIDGETETSSVHKLSTPIKITVKLTDDQISTDASMKRTYSIVRVHYNEETGKDEISVLDAEFDAANKTLIFETDCFSTYALAYSDAAVPITADGNMATLWTLALILTLLMAAVFAGRSFLEERR